VLAAADASPFPCQQGLPLLKALRDIDLAGVQGLQQQSANQRIGLIVEKFRMPDQALVYISRRPGFEELKQGSQSCPPPRSATFPALHR
jgi:hypothetical protein